MNNQHYLLAACAILTAGLITFFLIKLMLASSIFSKIQDIPNGRSLHQNPTPRFGGLALILGLFAGWYVLNDQGATCLYEALGILMLLSLLDDLRGLPSKLRLLVHLAVAIGFVRFGLESLPIYFAILFVFGVVWMTNLYNFMDGANGLAGGMAVIGFSSYTLAAWSAGEINFAFINLVIVASSLAFLVFNFGKAKVFMGDAGSIPLGFLAAAIGLLGWQKGIWPLWFPAVIFSSFILDATVTLLKRFLNGERVWEAHREHYYQRLIQMGLSHRKTALIEYCMMGATGIVAILGLRLSTPYIFGLLSLCLFLMLSLMRMVDLRWQKSNPGSGF